MNCALAIIAICIIGIVVLVGSYQMCEILNKRFGMRGVVVWLALIVVSLIASITTSSVQP